RDSQGGAHRFHGMKPPRGTMKTIFAGVIALIGASLFASTASAGGVNPYCSTGQCGPTHGPGSFFPKQPSRVFQAAPWYRYWPYNSHFQPPAPLTGAYYAPPAGGALVNPYFPATPAYTAPIPVPAR